MFCAYFSLFSDQRSQSEAPLIRGVGGFSQIGIFISNQYKMKKSRVFSVLESLFFASPKPVPESRLKTLFDKKQIKPAEVQKILEEFQESCQKDPSRGVVLERVGGGWQMRTKAENKEWMRKALKKRPFRLSPPALETLAIIACHQPCPRQLADEIRGADSSGLFRTLMERGLICFAGKSDRPGKPSLYKTSSRFLTVFGFKSLNDLPSQEEIKKLIPPTEISSPALFESASKDVQAAAARRAKEAEEDKKAELQIDSKLKTVKTRI